MKSLVVLLLFLLTAGSFLRAEDVDSDALIARRAVEALKVQLRDPGSLRISRVILTKRDVHGAEVADVCVEYNAKNGYGGYAGTDVFAMVAQPNKDKFYNSDGFPSSLGLCRLDEKLAKKGKATARDLTSEALAGTNQ